MSFYDENGRLPKQWDLLSKQFSNHPHKIYRHITNFSISVSVAPSLRLPLLHTHIKWKQKEEKKITYFQIQNQTKQRHTHSYSKTQTVENHWMNSSSKWQSLQLVQIQISIYIICFVYVCVTVYVCRRFASYLLYQSYRVSFCCWNAWWSSDTLIWCFWWLP